jgi:hypothetical protein
MGTNLQPPPSNKYRRLKTWWRNMIEEGTQGNQEIQVRVQKLVYTA